MSEELEELKNIKKLLVLLLMANKVDQGKISKVLGLTQPGVSKMLSRKASRNAKEKSKGN